MFDKLYIYYQPVQDEPDVANSFSLSYYEFDVLHNTYRSKIVREQDGKKYKIKRYMGDLGAIIPLLEKIDLSQYPAQEVDFNLPYFYIKYGAQSYSTNDKSVIQGLLNDFRFDDFFNYPIAQYQVCD